jgi:hypothetical protein
VLLPERGISDRRELGWGVVLMVVFQFGAGVG